MNESVSATSAPAPTKLDIKTDNIYSNDGTTQHLRTVTTTTTPPITANNNNLTNSTINNTPRTPTDARIYHPSMIRTPSVDNSNVASKSTTIFVQNPFDDPVRPVEDASNDSSNAATKYLLHSPSPSKQHSISNVQSPRTISRTPTPGTPHQTPDDVSMPSPSMTTNLQRHPSQQVRLPLPPQQINNGAMTTARNIVPQPPPQQSQQQQMQSIQHHVRFNQDLLHNYGINVPMTRQPSQPGTNEPQSPSNPPSVTSLIPLPSPLPNNLGVNMHHMNQASITPTIIGGFPLHQSASQPTGTTNTYISAQQTNVQNTISPHGPHHSLATPTHHAPPGIYVNTRPMSASQITTITGISKLKQQQQPLLPQQQQQAIRPGIPTNGTSAGPSTVVLRYPQMVQTSQPLPPQQQQQQHRYPMMKPQMIPPNAFGPRGGAPPLSPQIIMHQQQQQTPIIYDPNNPYRTASIQPQPSATQVQQQQQQQHPSVTPLQSNLHMNDMLINQQKHLHSQSMPQQVLQIAPGMLATDDNILKSLLQINPQAVSFPLLYLPFLRLDLPFRIPKKSLL